MSDEQSGGASELKARLQECYTYGNQKMTQGDHDYATEMFIQCLLGDPANIVYIQAFILNLRQKYKDNKKGNSWALLKSGKIKTALKTAWVRQKWKEVLENGAEALKINPWDSNAYLSMGRACHELDYLFAELAYYKQAVESSPKDAEINRTAARALQEMEEYDHAIACWNRVLQTKPNDDEARKSIGDLMIEKTIKKGKYNASESQTGKTTVQYREDVQKIDYEERKELSAEELFEKNVRKNPEDITLYIDRADVLFQSNQIKEAENILQRLLKVQDKPEFRLRLIEVQHRRLMDDLAKIKTNYESSTKPEIKTQLKAQFASKKDELSNVTLKMYTMRVEQNPGNTRYRYDMGTIYQSQGKFKEAIGEFQAAKSDISLQGECLLALGQCFQQIKQYKLAMTHYRQAVDSITGEGDSKKKSLYLAARLAYGLQDYVQADDFATQLAAIDFSYKDVGELLDKIAEKRIN
ncbi:MAG: tetratricopeptide repeat protein [Planctomycetaceae bacterium]|jgi:tetratricopeptide (TPR) repeat protein|nr:tetratricopeptide repeat protein [Planctomycetaceae bacterium]